MRRRPVPLTALLGSVVRVRALAGGQLWGYIILGSVLLTSACSIGDGLTGFAPVASAARAYMAGSVILAMIFVRPRARRAPRRLVRS